MVRKKIDYKQCTLCKEYFLPTDENFYRNRKTGTLFPYCKNCTKEKSLIWKNENVDKNNLIPLTRDILNSISERFWKKVDIKGENDCWNWMGATSYGYGQFGINYKLIRSHRISYMLSNGEIPDNFVICHSCDNKKCCNPKHLFLGTQSENILDAVNKGRWK